MLPQEGFLNSERDVCGKCATTSCRIRERERGKEKPGGWEKNIYKNNKTTLSRSWRFNGYPHWKGPPPSLPPWIQVKPPYAFLIVYIRILGLREACTLPLCCVTHVAPWSGGDQNEPERERERDQRIHTLFLSYDIILLDDTRPARNPFSLQPPLSLLYSIYILPILYYILPASTKRYYLIRISCPVTMKPFISQQLILAMRLVGSVVIFLRLVIKLYV